MYKRQELVDHMLKHPPKYIKDSQTQPSQSQHSCNYPLFENTTNTSSSPSDNGFIRLPSETQQSSSTTASHTDNVQSLIDRPVFDMPVFKSFVAEGDIVKSISGKYEGQIGIVSKINGKTLKP